MFRAGAVIQIVEHVLDRLRVRRLCLLCQLLCAGLVALDSFSAPPQRVSALCLVRFIRHVSTLSCNGQNGGPATRLS
jgi:hypothetical protein